MNEEKIERLKEAGEMAGLDLKILPYGNMSEESTELVAVRVGLDGEISAFERSVSEGRITDKDFIRDKIDRFLKLLGHTVAINHLPAADKATETCNLLTEPQRLILLPVIREIYSFRARIREKAEKVRAPEICGQCGGGCCERDIEKMISEMDFFYMFYVLREKGDKQINKKIWEILKMPDKADSRCRFQGEDSCIIPAVGRPGFCQTYYCEDIPVIGQTKTDLYADKLDEELKKLQKKLRKEGFDLKCAA